MGSSPTSGIRKKALRQVVRRSRAERGDAEKLRVESALAKAALETAAVRAASCVAVYASLPDEPGTGELRRALRALGVRVILPVALENTLDWALDAGELSPTGVLGLLEPAGQRLGPGAAAQADVLLIPAMAVDTSGLRLGRGRGYYDRTLAGLGPEALVIALVHDDELVDEVPAEPHDRRVDGVLTPTRRLFFSFRA